MMLMFFLYTSVNNCHHLFTALYEILFSVKYKRRHFEKCLGGAPLCPY